MGCACMKTKSATANTVPSAARQLKTKQPQGDVNLPSAQKRYSEKSARPSHFGRLSLAYNDEKPESNKATDEESPR